MNKIHQTIELFLQKHKLNKPQEVFLVAFSGGYDSMCLLDSLQKITKNKIIAIHLNHNWRGVESDLEEKNCKKFCKEKNIEFYSEKLNKNIPHTETAAREARYDFFETCAEKFNSKIIFTAHNKNDNVETLLYRICKGTGVSGLQGIAENRGNYYRPLLEVSRNEIENYCKTNNLTQNNDSSNYDTKYKRNFIRAEVIPILEKINPNIIETISTLSTVAKEETEIVEEYINQISDKISKNEKLKTQEFIQLSSSVQSRIVYNLFIKHNLDYDRTKILKIKDFILKNSNSKSGKTCSLTTNLWIFTNDKIIEIIDKKVETRPKIKVNKEGTYNAYGYIFELQKYTEIVKNYPQETENFAYINLENFSIDFEIRTRQDGDIIQPFGLNGTQKLKKYLNSKKIPNHKKNNLLFLTQGKEIFWAIGLGISDKIKVIKRPTHIIKFYKKES